MSTPPSMFRTRAGQARYFAAYEATLALWPVPVESFDVPTRFGQTHVNACGPQAAPPLVLLPGQAISSTMWYPNVGALSQAFRVYAPDILGDMGKSIQTRPFTKPTEFADWLNDLFDGLQIERADVAGLSYGGFIALRLALSVPERVRKLVLMAPASLMPIRPVFFLRMAGMALPAFVLSFEAKQKLLLGVASPQTVPAITQMMTPNDFRYSMYLPPVHTNAELQQLKSPTLLLLGEHEVIYDHRAARQRAVKLIPSIETDLIPGAGHALNFDQPDLVNQRILKFLNQNEAGRAKPAGT
jgi:pimeloyl-ACP methyl ester carboxylesterase